MKTSYFDWLVEIISVSESFEYTKLYEQLFETEFYAKLDMDENRVCDGLELRRRFILEEGNRMYTDQLDAPPYCTCLEMIVALAIRMENDILFDPDEGNRTGIWFHIMLENLGLTEFTDDRYDREEVDYILKFWLERKYKNNGRPYNLFVTDKDDFKFSKSEIWYQMNYFVDEFL